MIGKERPKVMEETEVSDLPIEIWMANLADWRHIPDVDGTLGIQLDPDGPEFLPTRYCSSAYTCRELR